MKELDTNALISSLRELTDQGQEVRIIISGSSMSPFLIHERDSIVFSKPTTPLKRGDMVFYQRDNGQFVMHRICRVKPEGLYIIGDAQTEIEGPVRQDQVFARITRVNRKGKWIGPQDLWWKFFRTVWLWVIPVRREIMWLYNKVM